MVFSAKTNGADEWKAIISAISTLVEEATFEATVEGISFRGMDPSHVALIDINWPNSAFEKYNCDSDIKFGVRIDYDAKISLTASALDKILGDVQVVSDYLTITSNESSATFSGKGDSGEVDIALESGQDEIQELSVKQESTGTYSLEYLNPIIKAVGGSVEAVTCEYSSAKPLRVEFKVSNLGQIHFYLAPRVES